eukprot:Nk52_evm16s2449 gene=Nk52_evmTU16s2449
MAKVMSKGERAKEFILPFENLRMDDVPLVGGKNASLGEMIYSFSSSSEVKINVPSGFALTAAAYRYYMEVNKLSDKIAAILDGINTSDMNDLARRGREVRMLILQTPFPSDLDEAVKAAYRQMCERYSAPGKEFNGPMDYSLDVAVRSSATAEDLPDASFAGQQESYLNVQGERGVVGACLRCYASLFTDRAISYRVIKGYGHSPDVVALSCGVQKMVRSDLASAGVMFSIDTETGFQNACLVTAAYGLGESVVQGSVNPDEYLVFKPTLFDKKEGGQVNRLSGAYPDTKYKYNPILDKRVGSKQSRMVYDFGGNKTVKTLAVPENEAARCCLNDEEILLLARWACTIEKHYTNVHGRWTPMDIEWAKDGITGELFIVQARPETVESQKKAAVMDNKNTMVRVFKLLTPKQELPQTLAKGRAVGKMIGAGKANVILDVHYIENFKEGEVLVTNRTDPDWEPIMKKASAIVTNQGGRTCHAAIIARELGIPAIVGCEDATSTIEHGRPVTASCAQGETGRVYDGILKFQVEEHQPLSTDLKTKTNILVNVGNPEEAFSVATIPCSGVGLARMEFIIANHIRIHPLALLNYENLEDEQVKIQIAEITNPAYSGPGARKCEYFVDRLAAGVSLLAAAFYPKPVIVRMSDFKSNEYANLLGGQEFEPNEENPMLGWRGASRYYHEDYRDGFALECRALKRVREEMGLTNLIPMIPFCRTPEEGKLVVKEMAKNGLERKEDRSRAPGSEDLQIYMMCEIPSNVLLLEQFAEIFDGFSIGSNDLTQLVLGLDRDSHLVAKLFDERNKAVTDFIKTVIQKAKKAKRKIGICGQAPSDYPEFARSLVEEGIDSISLNPDSVMATTVDIQKLEKQLKLQ